MSYFDFDPSENPNEWLYEPVRDYDGPSWDPEDDNCYWDEDSKSYIKMDD